MTAAHALTAPRHAAPKTSRKLSLPSVPKPTMPKLPSFHRPAVTKPTFKAARITETGKALYSVDTKGEVNRNILAASRDGISTFAVASGAAIDSAFSSHWLVEMFETEQQRKDRVNARAVAAVLQLVGALVRR